MLRDNSREMRLVKLRPGVVGDSDVEVATEVELASVEVVAVDGSVDATIKQLRLLKNEIENSTCPIFDPPEIK